MKSFNKKEVNPTHASIESALVEGADFNDRIWLWWEKNKNLTAICILLAIIGVASIQIVNSIKQKHSAKIQAAFIETFQNKNWIIFAQTYPDEPLSGISLIMKADEFWEKGQINEAQSLYTNASKTLEGTPLSFRAQLGEGMCQAKLEDNLQGLSVLKNLAMNSGAPNALRAQAAYELALIAQTHGQNDICMQWLKVIYE